MKHFYDPIEGRCFSVCPACMNRERAWYDRRAPQLVLAVVGAVLLGACAGLLVVAGLVIA